MTDSDISDASYQEDVIDDITDGENEEVSQVSEHNSVAGEINTADFDVSYFCKLAHSRTNELSIF